MKVQCQQTSNRPDNGLACCSASKSGIAATKGMEKKFELAPVK